MKRNAELVPEDRQVFKESAKRAGVFTNDHIRRDTIQEILKPTREFLPFLQRHFSGRIPASEVCPA